MDDFSDQLDSAHARCRELEEKLRTEEVARAAAERSLDDERKLTVVMGKEANRMEQEMRMMRDQIASKNELVLRSGRRVDDLERMLARSDTGRDARDRHEALRREHEYVGLELKDAKFTLNMAQRELDVTRRELDAEMYKSTSPTPDHRQT